MADYNQYRQLLDRILDCSDADYIQAATDREFDKHARGTLLDHDLADTLKDVVRKGDAVAAVSERISRLFGDAGRSFSVDTIQVDERPGVAEPCPPHMRDAKGGQEETTPAISRSNRRHNRFFRFEKPRGLADFCDAVLRSGLGIGHEDIHVSRDPLGLRITTKDPFPDESWRHIVTSLSGRSVDVLDAEWQDLNSFARVINPPASSWMPESCRRLMLAISANNAENLREPTIRTFDNSPSHRRLECKYFSDSLREYDGWITLFVLVDMEQPLSKAELRRWVGGLPEATEVYYPLSSERHSHVIFLKMGYKDPGSLLTRLYQPSEDAAYTLVCPQKGFVRWTTLSVAQSRSAPSVSYSPVQIDLTDLQPQFPKAAGKLHPWDVKLRVYPSTFPQSLAGRGNRIKQLVRSRERLADLEDQFERGEQWVSEQCRVAMEFFATSENGDDPLPKSLQRFLDRPHVRLDDYDMSCFEWNKRRRYLVISRTPLDLAEALSAGADNMFIQDVHWLGWGVNVFIEQGKRFRPRIDGAAMVEQFHHTLERKSEGRQIHSWLIRTIGSTAVPMGIPNDSVQALSDSMQIVNECSFTVDASRPRDYSHSAKKAFSEQLQSSEPALNAFYSKCADEIDDMLEELGSQVADVAARVEKIQEDTENSLHDVRAMETLFQNYPRDWEDLVRRILGFHLDISQQRAGLFASLQQAHEDYREKHKEALETFRGSADLLDDVRSEVAENDQSLNQHIQQCDEKWRRTRHDLQSIHDKINSTWGCLRDRLAVLEPNTNVLEESQELLAKRTRELETLESEVADMADRCAARIRQTDGRIAKLKEEKQSLETRLPQCRSIVQKAESDLNSQVKQLREMFTAIDAKRRQLDASNPFRQSAELLLEIMRSRKSPDFRSKLQAISCFAKLLKNMPDDVWEDLFSD
ncbi:MAG: hypothetical protein ACQESR_12765 [Planctomycetota bacterium]